MESEERQEKIIEQLVSLNEQMALQNSTKQTLMRGVVSGIGFFIGSAILATIVLGLLGPWFGKIEWVHDNYTRGTELLK
jgi:hypothetical protein